MESMGQSGAEFRKWGDVPAGNDPQPKAVEDESAFEIVESIRMTGTTEIKVEI